MLSMKKSSVTLCKTVTKNCWKEKLPWNFLGKETCKKLCNWHIYSVSFKFWLKGFFVGGHTKKLVVKYLFARSAYRTKSAAVVPTIEQAIHRCIFFFQQTKKSQVYLLGVARCISRFSGGGWLPLDVLGGGWLPLDVSRRILA